MWDFSDLTDYTMVVNQFNFDFCENILNLDEVVNLWTSSVKQLAKDNIPNRIVTIRPHDKPWYNSELRRLLRKKNRKHKIAKTKNSEACWAKFREIRNQYNHDNMECKKQKAKFEKVRLKKMVRECNENPKNWWTMIKHIP